MFNHISVLLDESIESLNIKPEGIYVDATCGGAGHACKILSKLNEKGKLYCFDKDADALHVADKRLSAISDNYVLIHSDFSRLKESLSSYGVSKIDGILFDIGVSSYQFDTPERGFSYKFDARLDMRMDKSQMLSAFEVVNMYSEDDLVRIFQDYGEEKYAKRIARNIMLERKMSPIESTTQLVDIIKKSLPSYELNKKGHPAKQVFQAIRIEVNGELDALESGLEQALSMLNTNGRCSVISFHSLEDRIVKKKFNDVTKQGNDSIKGLASNNQRVIEYRLVNRHPITSTQGELDNNNRAHSAKLRTIERI